ncbi:helix-turn-helix domain-containing protein [Paenibacillus filicis]|uniref:Helix-turn-helix domain-containing protein n=1 Tax=Paenibacillus gyeongsangnamensis TaxID=3388067 RepID=A0ABT4Q285_9BACL|nr:helix-turn-helix domain-containing protein [Paenibacillus filicis]MCZ8510944.1 helix-turn-helix domain-containing protein [Paenibacillus filicis]
MKILDLFFNRNKSMLRKMIIVSLFISIVPTLITGLGGYLYASSVVETEVNKANYQILKTASDNVDKKLQTIQINLLQMMNTPYFLVDYNVDLKADQIDFFGKVYKTLGAFQNSNQNLRELALYIRDVAYISPTSGTIRPDGLSLSVREKFDYEMKQDYRLRWLNDTFPVTPYTDTGRGVTLINKFPLGSSSPIGLVLASVDSSQFREIIGDSTVYNGQFMFVVSENGKLVATTSDQLQPSNFYESILQAGEEKSKYNFNWKGTTYLVTSITSNYSHWKYIDVIPVKELNAKSRGIAFMTMGIVFFFILVGVGCSFFGSRKIYRPVERLLASIRSDSGMEIDSDEIGFVHRNWLELRHTASQLKNELSHQLPIIRESFVLQLLQGQFAHYTDKQLVELLKRYQLPDQAEFAVLAVVFDMDANRKGKFRDSDKELMLFSMKNIIDEFIPLSGWQGVTVNVFNDSLVTWLWSVPETPEADKEEPDFFAFAENIRNTLSNYLHLPVTVGLSEVGYETKEVPRMYRQAMFALESRIITGRNKVLQDEGSLVSESSYPVELEQHYENSLKLGNQEEAERMLNDFMETVRRLARSPEGVLLYYNQLLAATMRTAYSLKVEPKQLFEQYDPYTHMRKLKSIEDINLWFVTALISPIIAAAQGNRHGEYERMVMTAVSYIHDNYHRDISLEECADYCNVSTFQLSKWFKKIMQTPFIDYLTEYRIEKAKHILAETDLSVSEISLLVGYQRQNFMRVFKKQVGTTPGQYRESVKQLPS